MSSVTIDKLGSERYSRASSKAKGIVYKAKLKVYNATIVR